MFRELARKKQQLSDEECFRILETETRGVLSVNGDGGYPYAMPMNHYFCPEDGKIYFHSGRRGHRTEALLRDPRVCYCVYDRGYKNEGHWAWNVKSVVVFGKIEITDDAETVRRICEPLSRKFTDDENYIRTEIRESSKNTLILCLTPEHICGKLVNEA
ncbi:MAG: pyridoxamine 5'-phosphate oxidase family protein [Clostridia bacterium]|nr:pyridoxamine 5'-phosphate oxidase family protein [Clostridia bacterium]